MKQLINMSVRENEYEMIRLNSDFNSGVDETINPITSHIPVSTAHVSEHSLNLSIFYCVLSFPSGGTQHLHEPTICAP